MNVCWRRFLSVRTRRITPTHRLPTPPKPRPVPTWPHEHPMSASHLLSSSSPSNGCRPLASASCVSPLQPTSLPTAPHGVHPMGLTLRCSVMDVNGSLVCSGHEYAKAELCHLYQLQPRDLRKLDDRFQHQLPAILVRPGTILVNLGLIKAIIRQDSLTLVEPADRRSSPALSRLLFELENAIQKPPTNTPQLPFELRTLEVLLAYTLNLLRDEVEHWLPPIETFLHSSLSLHHIDKDTLQTLLLYSKTITQLQGHTSSIRAALTEVLNSDDDLSAITRGSDHDEVEMLLENYLKETDEMLMRLNRVEDDMQSTEDIMNISLDSQRNSILVLECRLAMATCAIASGAFVSSLFGMNLESGLESDPVAFWAVSLVSAVVVGGLFRGLRRKI